MDYLLYYQLNENPFDKEVDVKLELTDYKELQVRFEYLLTSRGVGLFTGRPGVGKTYAIKKCVQALNENLYKICYLSLSTVTVNEFYRSLALALDLEPVGKKIDNFRAIQNRLTDLRESQRKLPVIIIDEAQYLNTGILQDLTMLLNFNMDSQNNVALFLVGLPTLATTLSRVALEPIKQRITSQYRIIGIDEEEVKIYLNAKLKSCGRDVSIFDEGSIHALAGQYGGSMRKLNNLASQALIIGATKQQQVIDNEIILLAAQELFIQ